MPTWVSGPVHSDVFLTETITLGENFVSAVDTMAFEDGSTRREVDQEDDHDPEQDEGAGYEGDFLQVSAGQCVGHG